MLHLASLQLAAYASGVVERSAFMVQAALSRKKEFHFLVYIYSAFYLLNLAKLTTTALDLASCVQHNWLHLGAISKRMRRNHSCVEAVFKLPFHRKAQRAIRYRNLNE